MAQAPLTRIRAPELKVLLARATGNTTFRDQLISTPADMLKAEGLRPDQHWIDFFNDLQASDFEKRMKLEINVLDGEAEAGL